MLSESSLKDRLRELATSTEHRPKSALIREVAPDIESAMAAGVSRKTILVELQKAGIQITLATLDSNLQRIRKRARMNTSKDLSGPMTGSSGASLDRPRPPSNSHSSSVIDDIVRRPVDMAALAALDKTRK